MSGLVDGEKVLVSRAGKTGYGFVVKGPDSKISFRIENDPASYTAAGLCIKLTSTQACDGKRYIRVFRNTKWVTLASLEKKVTTLKSESRANKIYEKLQNGEPVFLSKGSTVGEVVKEADTILIRSSADGTTESVSKFCKTVLQKQQGETCDGYARLYVERGSKRVSFENLLKPPTQTLKRKKEKAETTVVLQKADPKIETISHLLKDGTEIYVKDPQNKYFSGKIYLKSDDYVIVDDADNIILTLPQFCKKYVKKGECNKFDKLYIEQKGVKVKLQNLRNAAGKKYFKSYVPKTVKNAKLAVASPDSNKRDIKEKRLSFHKRDIQHYEARAPEREKREIARLYTNLTTQARKGKIEGLWKEPKARMEFVEKTLKAQKNTCYLSDVAGAYCWDIVNPAKYLKLEWAHLNPTSQRGDKPEVKENLSLMCSRCNQNLQGDRRLDQLPMEFLTKTRVLLNKLPGYSKKAKQKIEELIKMIPEA